MKILWLCNVPISIIARDIGSQNVYGGWLDGAIKPLIENCENEILYIFPYKNKVEGEVGRVKYVSYPTKYTQKNKAELFDQLINAFNPDIIHIFGTEFEHALIMVDVCERLNKINNTIISIQGICSKISQAYYADLPRKVITGWTLRDIIKLDNLQMQRRKFAKKAMLENLALQKVENVIGRTDFDKACTTQVNPDIKYYFCNETLRDVFYEGQWEFEKCEKHTIFVSQCNYPIKGFHKLLEAMPLILKQYPDCKIYTTGKDLLHLSFKQKLKLNSYQKYIIKLIKKNNLENKVVFKGVLDKNKMKDAYLNANCFVSCSSIENSPNSVGEAMLLGVPVVASDVGGVKNLLEHNSNGYIYPFNEEYMLAYYVCQVFKDKDKCIQMTKQSKIDASIIFDKEKNLNNLLNIYNEIIKR